MQAIVTKFIAPTNTRGARIKASCQARTLTMPWAHSMNPSANHATAAAALATQLGWTGRWIEGGLPDGSSVWTLDTFVADTFTVPADDHRCAPDLPSIVSDNAHLIGGAS